MRLQTTHVKTLPYNLGILQYVTLNHSHSFTDEKTFASTKATTTLSILQSTACHNYHLHTVLKISSQHVSLTFLGDNRYQYLYDNTQAQSLILTMVRKFQHNGTIHKDWLDRLGFYITAFIKRHEDTFTNIRKGRQ